MAVLVAPRCQVHRVVKRRAFQEGAIVPMETTKDGAGREYIGYEFRYELAAHTCQDLPNFMYLNVPQHKDSMHKISRTIDVPLHINRALLQTL